MDESEGRKQPRTDLSDDASKDSDDHIPEPVVHDCVESKDSGPDHTSMKFEDHPEDIVRDVLPATTCTTDVLPATTCTTDVLPATTCTTDVLPTTTSSSDVYDAIQDCVGIIQNIDDEVTQKRERQITIWTSITEKERELLELIKSKKINAEEKKQKKKEICNLIEEDSEIDVSIKTNTNDKEVNREKIKQKAKEIFAGDKEESFADDKEEIPSYDDSEPLEPPRKRLKGSHHGGDERSSTTTSKDVYEDILDRLLEIEITDNQITSNYRKQAQLWVNITKNEHDLFLLVKTKKLNPEEKKKKKQEISKLLKQNNEIDGYIKALEENRRIIQEEILTMFEDTA